jgi:SAM-dependent methyltransferase
MNSPQRDDFQTPVPQPRSWTARLCLRLLQRLRPREAGMLFEELQVLHAGPDPRIGAYALDFNNPQALCFLIDAYPTLQQVFARYPRMGSIRFLDIGPAFGASAGLLSQMHRSHFLGPRLEVEVMDILDTRQAFIELSYPLVRFLHGDVRDLPPQAVWDVVYCSNVIEHLDDPRAFIGQLLRHTRGQAVFLAPYREEPPLSLDHRLQITEDLFEGFDGFKVETMRVFNSASWPTTAEGVERQQILVVLAATHR